MLVTTQTDSWGMRHEIDYGAPGPAYYRASAWGNAGAVTVAGRELHLRSSITGSRQTLLDGDRELATAEHVGRKNWTVTSADGRVFRFRRTGFWQQSHTRVDDQTLVGHPTATRGSTSTIRVTGVGRSTLTADLPGLPPEAQVCVAVVLLNTWLNHAVLIPIAVAVAIPLFNLAT
ncbi:hypothetical protein [Tomitella gaofuii]|uniref:hypothetical protein n=1 Tax=Tomitella gaofuii TaxID=2760083 RepID=UPI0015FA0E0B|nr:hypothetical protein [Tomitella gaofuii]